MVLSVQTEKLRMIASIHLNKDQTSLLAQQSTKPASWKTSEVVEKQQQPSRESTVWCIGATKITDHMRRRVRC